MAIFKAEIEFEVVEINGEDVFDNAAGFVTRIRGLAKEARMIKNGIDHQPVFTLRTLALQLTPRTRR